jgi:hypothetical protein
VNAAFLLVTSAMLVGQAGGAGGDKKPPPPPPAVASSCGHDCDCDGFGHRLRDRLKGMFSRDCCDACQPTTCPTHHVHAPTYKSCCEKSCCDDGCKAKFWNRQPKCREHTCHAQNACTCDDGCERGILSRLRDRFHRGDRCCDSGCSTVAPVKSGEKIDATPKKMPVDPDKGKDKKPQEVRSEKQPIPFAVPANPAVPSVEVTPMPVPAPAPRVEGGRRDPF